MTSSSYPHMPGFPPGTTYHQRSSPPTDLSQPRVTYFITRTPSGLPVPLIPADELPFTVKLQDISRVLQPQDTYGLQYVGTLPYTGNVFKLDSGAETTSVQRSSSRPPNEPVHMRSQSGIPVKQFLAPDALARQTYANNSYAGTSSLAMRPPSASQTATSWRRSEPVNTTDTQSVIDAILRSEAGAETAERIGYRSRDTTPPPSGIMPDQDKKVFCTHWIMTGDCKFVQQGCRYKHEMPTEAKLKELGIRHTPRWWQEQNAVIRLGGARNLVGSPLKPLELLSRGKDDDANDESSSDESESVEMRGKHTTPAKPQQVNIASKQILQPNKPDPSKSSVIPPTRSSSPVIVEEKSTKTLRQPSTASDLIDFTVVASNPAPPPPLEPIAPPSRPRTTVSIGLDNLPSTPAKTTQVFVPAGESPDDHIADMKKREQRAAASRNGGNSKQSSPTNSSIKRSSSPSQGLLASKHAPPAPSNGSASNSPKRNKAGCRIRRPAAVVSSSSPPSATTITPTATSPSQNAANAGAAAGAAGADKKRNEKV